MKTNNKIQMFAVAAVALAAVACTDTWDEHYGNEADQCPTSPFFK